MQSIWWIRRHPWAAMIICCGAQALVPAGASEANAVDATTKRSVHTASEWQRINDRLFGTPATDLASLATRAYVWGMPLMHQAELKDAFARGAAGRPTHPLNAFVHGRILAGPENHAGVGLNNDTIYSLAWVDLQDGPIVMTAPDFGRRYYTFSMIFADTSAEQSLGQRTHGGQLPPIFIHGPGDAGQAPPGMVDVPSATRFLLIAGRILVRSAAEYPAVHALQDRLALWSWKDWQMGNRRPAAMRAATPLTMAGEQLPDDLAFLARLNRVLQEWTVLPKDAAIIDSLRGLGIGPGLEFHPDRWSEAQKAAIETGFEAGRRLVDARSRELGLQRNGWTINYRGPRFGSDYLLRAGVAKDQPNVAIPEEAIYPLARVDASGSALDGRHVYRIHFAAGLYPPVGAFWSVTAYDDKGRMMPNAAARYSIGDRSPGLVHDADGGLTVLVAAALPPGVPAPNWLPVDRDRPFYLMLRLYQPSEEILLQRWMPPPIERID